MTVTDRDALVALHNATDGENWKKSTNWNKGADLSLWHGIIVNDQGRAVQLLLYSNNLRGPIPPELGNLAALEELSLWQNQLIGPILPQLGNLGTLELLDLSWNKIDGTIPKELGKLIALKELYLYQTNVSGAIPKELGALGKLQRLGLSVNKLTGTIPKALGNLTALTRLWLNDNLLEGSIPKELGGLSEVQGLYLEDNQLTGHIPKELGALSKLEELFLYSNQLTGSIPKELGGLSKLKALWLSNNKLNGAIPKELGALGRLEKLSLSINKLTGLIPPELGNFAAVTHLYLQGNQLSDLGDVGDALQLVSRWRGMAGIHLKNNPWVMPPEAVVEAGLEALHMFLVDAEKASEVGSAVQRRRLLKVVLVGAASAGKTSLMRSIVSGHGDPTDPTEDPSTVGIELLRHALKGKVIEFYDCAGQVDYAGMHQIFLSRQALYLLVWDVQKCHGLYGDKLDEVIHDTIMGWLYTLHMRAPRATVMLVANKCDGPTDDFVETARRVEERATAMLREWERRRGWGSVGTTTEVNLLQGPSLVSCRNDHGITKVVERIAQQGATSIQVPLAWDLAIRVIDALRDGDEPLVALWEHLELPGTVATADGEVARPRRFITKGQLCGLWGEIVRRVDSEVRGTSKQAAVYNPDSALQGALWISEFAGHILHINDGDAIFLDVVWLSHVLSPILSHKLGRIRFLTSELGALRDDLVDDKILRWRFAEHLWDPVLRRSALQSRTEVGHALYCVLIKLGVVVPLGQTISSTTDGVASPRGDIDPRTEPPDVLVIMRLRKTCSEDQDREIRARTAGGRGVVLKWEFDAAGPPSGLLERLIASCHMIGVVEQRLSWRYGAVFKSHAMTRSIRLYTFVIRYDAPHRVLTVRVIGPLWHDRVWAAIRYVASAMVVLSKEWPGVLWHGWPECPKHPGVRSVYLATPSEASIGRPLIAEPVRVGRSSGCDCQLKANEALGLVLGRLGNVIDTRTGDPFEGVREHYMLQCWDLRGLYFDWESYAWGTAGCLWGFAVLLITTTLTTGFVEDRHTLWQAVLAVVCLLIVGAAFASCVACRRRATRSSGGSGIGPSDIEAVPLMSARTT